VVSAQGGRSASLLCSAHCGQWVAFWI